MPVSFNSPARNLFLLGSSGGTTVTNFFKTIADSSTDGVFIAREIAYNYTQQNYILSGFATDSQSNEFGWFEKRDYDAETDPANPTSTLSFRNKLVSSTDLRLMDIHLDYNDNIIACGIADDAPFIAKYSNAGVVDWQSTTFSGDVEYKNVCSDTNGTYYASGNTVSTSGNIAFVEKFDANGNPGWGKSATALGKDVNLDGLASNSRGHVVAVGHVEDDSRFKGYIVKINTNTGEVMWDKTLSSSEKQGIVFTPVLCEDVFIDDQDNIYVVGRLQGVPGATRSFVMKLSPEGNIIWQKETADHFEYYRVKADGATGQVVVFGRYYDANSGDQGGVIGKYSRGGDVAWRRTIFSSYSGSNFFGRTGDNGGVALDADPSFYYVLYTDDDIDELQGTPDSYTFGKVSTSGNGLGPFEYDDGNSESVYYDIINADDRVGRLQDGSVRNDVSDLVTYPFNATRISFDDFATPVANKKRQMDDDGNFEYSGSPAIRPADFLSKEYTTDEYGVPPQKNYIGLSESLSPASTNTSPTPNNTWTRQSTNVNITANDIANPLGVGTRAEKYNISATSGRRLEYGVPSGVFVAGQTYTYSWWMKAITTNAQWNFQVLYAGASNSTIRFADRDGNILENVSSSTVYKPTDTEWHRVVWTFTANNTDAGAIGGYNENSETGDLWYLWGAQLVDGINPLRYYTNNANNTPENAAGTEHTPDIVSGAYNFDKSEILQIGKIPGDFSEMTVEIWFKSDTLSNWQNPIDCNYHVNDANGTTQSGNIGPRLEINASGDCRWYWGSPLDDNNRNFPSANATVTTGQWYHAVLSIAGPLGSDGSAYINGEFLGTGGQSGTAGNTWYGEIRNLILGRGFVPASRYFDGQVGEVRIYPKALTAAQVFQNYNATRYKYDGIAPNTSPRIGPGIVYDGLVFNYDFSNDFCIERLGTIQG